MHHGDALSTTAQTWASWALPVFFLLLMLAGAAAWFIVGLRVRRAKRKVRPSRRARPWAIALLVVAGSACIVLALAMAIEAGRPIALADQAFSNALQAKLGNRSLQAFALITHLGDGSTRFALGIVVAAWLFALRRIRLALGWTIALAGVAMFTATLKATFERTRPAHDHGWVVEHSWSFPSGHASGAVAAYGMLAYVLVRLLPERWHPAIVAAATVLALAIGFSRVFLQVHFLSDVIAGFACGLAWLAVCIAGVEGSQRSSIRA